MIRSYLFALKASSRFGRADRLRKKGNGNEALEVAREGLLILDNPAVKRQRPAEAAALVSLTILVEELSSELQQSGASMNDLVDTLEFMRQLPTKRASDSHDVKEWVEYLEKKQGVPRA